MTFFFNRAVGLIALTFIFDVAVIGQDMARGVSNRIPGGVIHFYEPKAGDQPVSNADDPWVVGGEAIFWWADLEPEEGKINWTRIDKEIARWQSSGKRLDIRIGTAHTSPNISPAWLFDQYKVRRIGRGLWCDFEGALGRYKIGADAVRSENPGAAIGGVWGLATQSDVGVSRILLSLGGSSVFLPGINYSVQFDCYSATGVAGWVAVVSQERGTTNRYGFAMTAGERCSQSFTVPIPSAGDVQLIWGLEGGGKFAMDNINVIPIQPWPMPEMTDFESAPKFWKLLDGSELVRKPQTVLGGAVSVLISNATEVFKSAIVNDAQFFPIREGQGYGASFQFKALTPARIRLQLISKSPPFEVLHDTEISVKQGDAATHKWFYPAFIWRTNCSIEIGLVGPGQVVMDDLSWVRWSDRVTCFPDYFNPVFQEKWERLMRAVAKRYADHPGIGTISVGGFGRWEEVILDDDVHGILDRQWRARGFNQAKYLERIVECMDLFKELFPKKPLRICLAYGLMKQNDQDFMYRRVAQAAVARGIGLKQNGMSEKYDTWDAGTSASYLFNRYRFHPDVNLTYETAGQISVNVTPFNHSHPVSVLNRTIIDGADNLFLYGRDLHARHVHKYLGYADEVLGNPLFTTFYARLGDFSLVHEFSPAPQPYRNQWLGLRQFASPGGDPVMTVASGERCAATRPGSPNISFDLDDRQQYHGMFGVVAAVHYLDEGEDAFEINCYNNFTQVWENLGLVQKTGTGAWKWAVFQKPDWCRSKRNGGEDVHADIVINDLGEGVEHIAGVELQFVPAREWRRDLLRSVEPNAAHRILTNVISREIDLPNGEPLNWIAVPLWVGSLDRNSVMGRVIALTPQGEIVASEKEYYFPADKDWFEMPVIPVPGCSRYRIELSRPTGSVGWYEGANSELAFRAWRYTAMTNTVSTASFNGRPNAGRQEVIIEADKPFFGLNLDLSPGSTETNLTVQLSRALNGGGWSAPITRQAVQFNSTNPSRSLYFEPQTVGRYKLESTPDAAGKLEQVSSVHPIYLVRAADSSPPGVTKKVKGKILFDPKKYESLAETNLFHFVRADSAGDQARIRFNGPDAHVGLVLPASLRCSPNQQIVLRIANHSGAPLLRILWANKIEPFHTARSEIIPLVQNDTSLRQYVIQVGWNDSWHGDVDQLRIEFPGHAAGTVGLGLVELSEAPTRR